MKSSTLRNALNQMSPDYRSFFEALAAWRDSIPEDEYDREEVSMILEALARRKDFSHSDWESLTKIQSKLFRDKKNPAASAVLGHLDPAIARMAKGN